MQRVIDHILTGCVFASLALSTYVLTQPGSVVRSRYDASRRDQAVRAELNRNWDSLSTAGSPLGGPATGSTLLVFSDYECPFCRQTDYVVDTVVSRGTARVSHLHFPLSIHPAARGAALAAICAEDQHRFLEMHRRLMRTEGWRTDTAWVQLAHDTGVPDTNRFARCLSSDAARRRLANDMVLGERLRVSGTPSFFTKAGRLRGPVTGEAAAAALARNEP